jgi:phosphatidylserine decarboxylase
MTIHRAGYRLLGLAALAFILAYLFTQWAWPRGAQVVGIACALIFLLMLQFFRHPKRTLPIADDQLMYAPADGRVVVVEEVEEKEYFKDQRLQVSIFMSVTNVHVNRFPIGGVVRYYRYHPGKYLVAWHPKSSEENERSALVIDNGREAILLRQIAGALARRITTYAHEGLRVRQGAEMGFISFGSRVDIFLPLNARVEVRVGQRVWANRTVVAHLAAEPAGQIDLAARLRDDGAPNQN